MMILEVEVVGQQGGDPPMERLAARIVDAVAAAFSIPAGQLSVKVRELSAGLYAVNGPPPQSLPVFVRVLVRTKDQSVWPKRAETIALAVAHSTTRPRASVHVIFEPDATGRLFIGSTATSATRT